MQQRLLVWRTRWIAAAPIIIVSLFLLLSLYGLFGLRYVMLSSFLTLLFRTRYQQEFVPREMVRVWVLMLLACLAAFAASRNLVTTLALDLLVPFVLVYLLSSKFTPKAYFVYCMEFVFLQLLPIPLSQLPTQLAALAYGLGVTTAALWGWNRLMHRRRHYGTVRKGLHNLSVQLDKLSKGEDIAPEHGALPGMMAHMNQVIYATRGFTYLADGYGKINYWFMILFQRFYYFTDHFVAQPLHPADQLYFRQLSRIMAEASRQLNSQDNSALIRQVQQFQAEYQLQNQAAAQAMNQMLGLLELAAKELPRCSASRPQRSWQIPRHAPKRVRLAVPQQFQLRFALRLSVVLSLSFAFAVASGLEHAYWYPMTAFLMLMPYAEESVVRISNRILGTLGGVAVTMLLMQWVHTMAGYLAIMIAMTCFMYYVPVTSWTMTVYSTCYGLTMAQLSLEVTTASGLRILYVGLAAATAFLANRFLLPTTAKREFTQSVAELFDTDLAMLAQLRRQYQEGQEDLNQLRDGMVRSHLLEQEITAYMKDKMTSSQQTFYSQMLPMNRQLLCEMEQLNDYLRSRPKMEPQHSHLLEELLDNLEDSIRRVKESYMQEQLGASLQTDDTQNTWGQLEGKLYFNSLALGCLQTMRQMEQLAAARRQPR